MRAVQRFFLRRQMSAPGPKAPQREGLSVDSDDEAEAARPSPPGPGELSSVEELKNTIDSLRDALHAEKASSREKDVQIHKLLAERDMVVGASQPGRHHRASGQAELLRQVTINGPPRRRWRR